MNSVTVYLRAVVQPFQTQMMAAAYTAEQAARRMSSAVGRATAPITSHLAKQQAGISALGVRMLRFNSRLLHEVESAGRGMMAFGAAGMAGFALATKASVDFEAAMRNVNSIAQQTEGQFARTSASVLAMSRDLPQTAVDLARGMYDIESSGFHGAEALSVLRASAEAAAAGLTETRTAARSITAVMNAYGPAVGNASYVSDVLFQTVNVGVVTFEELASNMGQFIGLAAQAGVSIEEVGAAFATMTRAGLPAAQASTSLARTISSFVKPSEAMTAAVNQLGYESAYAMLQQKGLHGAVTELHAAAGGSVPTLARMFNEIRALRGVLALTARENELYAEVMTDFSDKQRIAGATSKALAQQEKSTAHQLALLRNAVTELGISITSGLLPGLKAVTGVATTFTQTAASMPAPVRGVGTAVVFATFAVVGLSGALIIAAPRIAATQLAMMRLSQQSLWLKWTMTGATTAMRTFGRGVMLAGVVLAMKELVELQHTLYTEATSGKEKMGPLTEALIDLGSATGDISSEFQKVQELGRFGRTDMWRGIADMLTGPPKGMKEGERLTKSLEDTDKALRGLVEGGHADKAKLALDGLARSMGMTPTALLHVLPQYAGAIGGVRAEAKAGDRAVDAFGVAIGGNEVDLEAASDAAEQYEDSLKTLTGALEDFVSVNDIISEVQDRHKRARAQAEDDAAAARERNEIERDRARALHDERNARERLADTAAAASKRERDARNDLRDAELDYQEAIKARRTATSGEEHRRAILDMERAQQQAAEVRLRISNLGVQAEKERSDALLDVAEAQERATRAVEDNRTAEEEYRQQLEDEKVTLAEFAGGLEAQIKKTQEWEANLTKIAQKNAPAEVLSTLVEMGTEGADIVAQLANANAVDFARISSLMVTSAKIGSEGYARELLVTLTAARVQAQGTVVGTVNDLLAEMNRIAPGIGATVPEVEAAAKKLGIAIASGVASGSAEYWATQPTLPWGIPNPAYAAPAGPPQPQTPTPFNPFPNGAGTLGPNGGRPNGTPTPAGATTTTTARPGPMIPTNPTPPPPPPPSILDPIHGRWGAQSAPSIQVTTQTNATPEHIASAVGWEMERV